MVSEAMRKFALSAITLISLAACPREAARPPNDDTSLPAGQPDEGDEEPADEDGKSSETGEPQT